MTSPSVRTLIAIASLIAFTETAGAQTQSRSARGRPASAPPAQVPATSAPTTGASSNSGARLFVTSLALRRDAVKEVSDQLAGGANKKHGWSAAFTKTLTGDKSRIDAAKRVLGQMAQSLDATGDTTIIVVIGDTTDRDKVVGSLAHVRRPVKMGFVDRELEDAVSDNTVLNGGMAGRFSDAASNLWVYLPRHGAAQRAKPDHVLSTKVASATLWNGLFAADGDAIDVDQVKSLAHQERGTASGEVASRAEATAGASPGAASPVAAPSADATAAGAPAIGDVVVPKIGNVKVLAEPSATSSVVGTVAKSDELVITGAPKNGFVRVEGASVSGWVSVVLVSRKDAPRHPVK